MVMPLRCGLFSMSLICINCAHQFGVSCKLWQKIEGEASMRKFLASVALATAAFVVRNLKILLLSAGLLGGLAVVTPAAATVLSFTYTNAADGNLTANFTIDVVGGYAVSGTGTVTSSFLSGTDTLNLVTYQTIL